MLFFSVLRPSLLSTVCAFFLSAFRSLCAAARVRLSQGVVKCESLSGSLIYTVKLFVVAVHCFTIEVEEWFPQLRI